MNILIVTATSPEIEPLVKKMGQGPELLQNLTRYTLKTTKIDVLVTGVGMVATTYWTGKILSKFQYDLAINVGICGSFNHEYPLGTVVNVVNDRFPETGAESGEYFLSLIDLKLLEVDEFPFQEGLLVNNYDFSNEPWKRLPRVAGVTVNTVHGNDKSIAKFRERIKAEIETMEGAAFFFSCFHENVRCIQLRAISNYVSLRDTSKWNIPLAIYNVNQVLLNFLNE